MTKCFEAKVLNASRQLTVMQVDASNEVEARRFVENAGGQLISLRVERAQLGYQRQKLFNLLVFNQQLLSLLEAGQSIVDVIEVLGKNDKRGHHRSVFDSLLVSLKEGCQLSEAMSKLPSVFPPLYIAMVRASETTGTVKHAVRRYTAYQTQVNGIRDKLKAAITYPAILLSVGFCVIAFLMFYVLPRFSAIYDDSQSANQMGGFVRIWGSFVRNNTTLAWGLFIAIVCFLLMMIFHPGIRKFVSGRFLAIAWIGERVWLLQLARMYRTLGMLLKSGVSVLAAMRMTQASLPEAMRPFLDTAIREVGEGNPVSSVMMRCNLSTEIAQRLLVAGETSGNLDEMMERVADFYDQETAIWIATAGRVLEPVLMVGIGLIIGGIVLMLYSPIFDLANIV